MDFVDDLKAWLGRVTRATERFGFLPSPSPDPPALRQMLASIAERAVAGADKRVRAATEELHQTWLRRDYLVLFADALQEELSPGARTRAVGG